MKHYFYLACSIVFEVFATTMLKFSLGFTVFWPSFGVVIGYAVAFYMLSLTLKTLPLGNTYAIWSGVGTIVTVLLGIIIWKEPFTFLSLIGLTLIIGGVLFLNMKRTTKEN